MSDKELVTMLRRIDSHTTEIAMKLRWLYPSEDDVRDEVAFGIDELSRYLECGVQPFTDERNN